MIHKLKFRVWCKRTQEYHTPIDEEDYDEDGENIWLHMCIDTNGRLYFIETSDECAGFEYVTQDCEIIDDEETKDFIIEQYTGLKDKNGKEIYEGDIINDGNHICEIKWSNHFTAFEALNENEGYKSNVWFEAKYGEVIGNIHENPELIEGRK